MAYIESTKAILTKGVGRPDYTGEQWQAKVTKRVELHEKEVMKVFMICGSVTPSPYPWVVAPLAVGAVMYLVDTDTGLPMPYVVPVGFTFEIIYVMSSGNQNQRLFTELDTFLLFETYNDAMNIYVENEVISLNTKNIDPLGLAAHILGFGGVNLGIAAMVGTAEVVGILHDLHTEVPTMKTIRCKWCGNTTSTSLTTVKWNCTKCGKLNLYLHPPSTLLRGGTK